MKKKQKISLIITLLIIVAIIVMVIKITSGSNKNEHKLAKINENLNSSQTYLFEIQKNDDNKTIMAKKGDKTIIDQYSKDSRTTTLVKENNTYLVLHDREEYYIYEQNNVEQSILTDGIKEVIEKEYTTGEEKVRGKKYYYEEYNGSTMFMITNPLDVNQENIKTRFYFDKNDNLVFIKTLLGEEQEILKVKLEQEVDDSIFEIPSNYAEY